jgi:hypothetical protein
MMNAMPRYCLAFLLALWASACLAGPPTAGMVLDLQGPAELSNKGERAGARVLDYLTPGAQLVLPAGSRASVSHYGAKMIYRLTGPVQVEVEAGGLRHLSGSPLQTASIAEKAVTAALHPNLGPAAMKMRALPQIEVRSPANGGSVLLTRPAFRWNVKEAGSCQVDLMELPDRPVAQGKVTVQAWDLPARVELAYGKSYRWTVACTSGDGKARAASATFSLPSKADADMIAGLAPAQEAGVDEWVLYATILKEWNMTDAANEAWLRIAARRPDLGHAR